MFFHNPQLPAPNNLDTKHKIIGTELQCMPSLHPACAYAASDHLYEVPSSYVLVPSA